MRLGALTFLIGALTLACDKHDEAHDHSEAHPSGHDHHEEGHGHDEPMQDFTYWSDTYEAFGEHSVAKVGDELAFLVHLTVLHDFRPLKQGKVSLEFSGPEPLRAEAEQPVRPGIFELRLTPRKPGKYRGRLMISGPPAGSVEGFEVEVSEAKAAVAVGHDEHDHDSLIEFLKEQQWGVPFATAFPQQGTMVPSVQVAGRVETPPGGSAEVSATVTGRLAAPAGGLPRPGSEVKKGQVLALLMPAPSSPEEAARAGLLVAEAEARASRARAGQERAERLFKDEAISQRELEDARRENSVAEEAVRAARNAASLYAGARGGAGSGAWRLTAPIAGTLTKVSATPGATVAPGESLFRIVDTQELWITAKVPEQEAARLRADRDASFQISGGSTWHPLRVSGQTPNASIVSVGRTVDPTSRTVDLIYALKAVPDALRVGGLVRVGLPTGQDFTGITIPSGALINQDGLQTVYVQVDGEHFQERLVTVAAHAGDRIGVSEGLKATERIVVRGAQLLRLADKAKGGAAHGHIH